MSRPKACFFVEGVDADALRRIEFYAQDIQILEDAGFEIEFVSKLQGLRPADVFFVWWWTWALAPITYAKAIRRPVIVTGVLDVNYYNDRPWWHRAGMRWAFALADANVFCSEMELREIPRMFSVRNPSYIPLTVGSRAVSAGRTSVTRASSLRSVGCSSPTRRESALPRSFGRRRSCTKNAPTSAFFSRAQVEITPKRRNSSSSSSARRATSHSSGQSREKKKSG